MKSGSRVFAAFLVFLFAPALASNIVDRIAVSAGNQVITDSEIAQRISLTAFENNASPVFDPASRKAATERLIDQKLVEHEMDLGQYPRLDAARRAGLLSDYAKENFKSGAEAMNKELARYQLTPEDLEADLARQADLLTFLGVRFRPAVQIDDQEVTRYFQNNVRPKLADGSHSIEEFRAQIETELTSARADKDMESWLKEQRRRTKIRYLEQELAP